MEFLALSAHEIVELRFLDLEFFGEAAPLADCFGEVAQRFTAQISIFLAPQFLGAVVGLFNWWREGGGARRGEEVKEDGGNIRLAWRTCV